MEQKPVILKTAKEEIDMTLVGKYIVPTHNIDQTADNSLNIHILYY